MNYLTTPNLSFHIYKMRMDKNAFPAILCVWCVQMVLDNILASHMPVSPCLKAILRLLAQISVSLNIALKQ